MKTQIEKDTMPKQLFRNISKSLDVDLCRAVSLYPRLRLLGAEGQELPGAASAETAIGPGVPGQRAAVPVKKKLTVLLPVEGLLHKPEVVKVHSVAVAAYFLRSLRIVHLPVDNLLQTYTPVLHSSRTSLSFIL